MIRWTVAHEWPDESIPVIALGPVSSLESFAGPLRPTACESPGAKAKEGYHLQVFKEGRSAPAVIVAGNDARGVLFGVGRLLRELHMRRGTVTLADDLKIASAPKYPLRGHQLGYRPKTNSYDAWDLASGSNTSATWPSSAPTPSS